MATGTIVDVVMPQMGVSVSEGTVTRWLKNPGDTIRLDESLLEISTDKVDSEVPSPGEGVVLEILVQEGETVPVGTVLARIGDGEPAAADTVAPEAPAAPQAPFVPEPAAPPAGTDEDEDENDEDEDDDGYEEPEDDDETTAATVTAAPEGNGRSAHTFISPVVARIAAEHGIDPAGLEGTGRDGRVTKKDILAFVEAAASPEAEAAEPEAPAAAAPASPPPASPPPTPPEAVAPVSTPAAVAPPPAVAAQPPAAGAPPVATPPEVTRPPAADEPPSVQPPAPEPPRQPMPAAAPAPREPQLPDEPEPLQPGEVLEPITAMRRGIAEHMRRSLDTAAHVTSGIEVDMSKVAGIRERVKAEYQAAYGVNPTYLAFIARAAVDALRDWPWINAELRDDGIVTRNFVNLGFAVALAEGKGLIVPVLRNAEGLNLLGMARGIADLAERARTKKLLPDDVQGGTFTITNPGSFGTFFGTPIISRPQSGILGTYAVVKRPWVITDDAGQDAIAIRSIMNLTLTYDHRLVDGAYGAQFLRDLAERLQTWNEADY